MRLSWLDHTHTLDIHTQTQLDLLYLEVSLLGLKPKLFSQTTARKRETCLSAGMCAGLAATPGSALLSSAGELGIRVKIHFYARTPSHPQATPKWSEDTVRLPGYYHEHN